MYLKQTWLNGGSGGTPLSAARLQHLEDGLEAAAAQADSGVTLATSAALTADWPSITNKPSLVNTVAGRSGAVVLTAADVAGAYAAANPPPYPVTSVAGRGGAVVLTAADVSGGTFPGASYRVTSLGIGMAPARLLDITATGGDAVKLSGGNYRASGGYYIADQGFGVLVDQTAGNQVYLIGSGTTLKLRGGTGGTILRNNADTASIVTVDDTGVVVAGGNGQFNGASIGGNVVTGFFYDGANAAVRTSVTGGVYIQSNNGGLTYGLFGLNNTNLGLTAQAATMVPLIITGTTGQTADLFRAYDISGGTAVVKIDNTGNIFGGATRSLGIGFLVDPALTGSAIQTNPAGTNGGAILAIGRSSGNNVFIVRGVSGQTADIVQWQKSTGTIYASINGNGGLILSSPDNRALTIKADATALSPEIQLWDTKAGQATPSKYIRANSGHLQFINNAYTSILFDMDDTGSVTLLGPIIATSLALTSVTTSTTAPTGGAAGALPANPVGYVTVPINGTNRKIPYYT